MTRLSLIFAGAAVVEGRFELTLRATIAGDDRTVSVFVSHDRRITFPHGVRESGRSLGSAALDSACRMRAAQLLAIFDGATEWRRFLRAQIKS
jgi:hypothetical protein